MEFIKLISEILNSDKTDWNVIVCENLGLSNLNSFSVWSTGTGDFKNIEINSHDYIASYKKNLSICLAWGLTINDDFQEKWVEIFPDKSASSHYIDIFYNGMVVFRIPYVTVDGGRCYLPLPERDFDENKKEIVKLKTPKNEYNFIKLVNSFLRDYTRYDDYLKRAKIEICNEVWPN